MYCEQPRKGLSPLRRRASPVWRDDVDKAKDPKHVAGDKEVTVLIQPDSQQPQRRDNEGPRKEAREKSLREAPAALAALRRERSRAASASAGRAGDLPTETPEELPPESPGDLPPEPPTELPPGTPQEVPPGTPLDLPPRDPHTPEERTAPASSSAAAVPASMVVLLVEDDALIRQSTADMLFDLGHRVVEAGRAAQALETLEAQPVDLLLCDVSLPDVSGVELARRARLLHPGLPVVFATGHSVIEGLEEAGLASSSLLLAKPFEQDALSDCLAEATGAR